AIEVRPRPGRTDESEDEDQGDPARRRGVVRDPDRADEEQEGGVLRTRAGDDVRERTSVVPVEGGDERPDERDDRDQEVQQDDPLVMKEEEVRPAAHPPLDPARHHPPPDDRVLDDEVKGGVPGRLARQRRRQEGEGPKDRREPEEGVEGEEAHDEHLGDRGDDGRVNHEDQVHREEGPPTPNVRNTPAMRSPADGIGPAPYFRMIDAIVMSNTRVRPTTSRL